MCTTEKYLGSSPFAEVACHRSPSAGYHEVAYDEKRSREYEVCCVGLWAHYQLRLFLPRP